MYGRVIYSDQRVFISGQEVEGVQSSSASYEVPLSNIFIAGTGVYGQEVDGALNGTIRIDRLIVSQDDHITGVMGRDVSGCIAYKRSDEQTYKTLSFTNGRITSYSIECAVGEIAKSSFDISVYGNMGSGLVPTGQVSTSPVLIAKPGDLIMSLPEASTNRVQSINYQMSIPYSRKDFIGGITGECQKIQSEGISIDVSVTFHADDLESPRLWDQLCSDGEDLSFRFENCNGDVVRAFNAPNARFVGCSQSAGISDNLTFEFKYRSVISSTDDIAGALSSYSSYIPSCTVVNVANTSWGGDGQYTYIGSGEYGFAWQGPAYIFGHPYNWSMTDHLGDEAQDTSSSYDIVGTWSNGVEVTCA